jgi:divalent metal cation (Fe/Co/Zn/Cd) transporter
MHLGAHNILVAMDVEFEPKLTAGEIASAVDRLEAVIRHSLPDARHIYIEADSIRSAARERPAHPPGGR